ncbi:hypothetical protein BHE74_00030944 [Ensete ventricosum]|uniref:Uncharacterized protein n=1 Tax=Ensete ventricosum TaxID=4639 RepID=A0A444GCL7_ENSVE|nr:hypothetical protein B296_00030164 [Ensete ventricosum]RWW32636.1 hypothetical protein GW17_00002678 [Ensete ventricosum]RWW61957.1 hypothetical protein BHE74_00030944 [Ensete ventricosum]
MCLSVAEEDEVLSLNGGGSCIWEACDSGGKCTQKLHLQICMLVAKEASVLGIDGGGSNREATEAEVALGLHEGVWGVGFASERPTGASVLTRSGLSSHHLKA